MSSAPKKSESRPDVSLRELVGIMEIESSAALNCWGASNALFNAALEDLHGTIVT